MISKEEFKQESGKVIEWIDQYFKRLESFPVKSQVSPAAIYNSIPAQAPATSESLDDILAELDSLILPGITHWQHPNFHAYFPANSSIESLFAEMITAAIGAQCMIWDTSPAAAELEERMMEWLREMIGLPAHFEGVIQDSASSASLVAILTAREVKTNFQSNENGVPNNLRIYCSTQAHSSIEKAVGISGIGKKNLIKVPIDSQQQMDPIALEKQIEADISLGLIPCCVVAALGSTGTVSVDPLERIGEICRKHSIWFHIDAAYAGAALILPEYQEKIRGIHTADSFVFNAHKWLFTNFDCSAYYVKSAESLIKTFEVLPEYLKTSNRGQVNDYRDWGIPLGRRFRALKLWFVLRGFGKTGLQERLRKHIQLNTFFAENIEAHADYELIMSPFLNYTCFRMSPGSVIDKKELDELNAQLLSKMNASGKVFLSHTKVNGDYVLRMVIGQTYVEKSHIEHALQVIFETGDTLLNSGS